ncbi:MAG TPA: class I SAM-dependent methyltransferase [Caulobacteraceae bacterium]|nr:class I SAM-dependent methyltransferase [Caulobacteraceae bacterium]
MLARMEQEIAEYWPLIGHRRRLLDVCAGTGEFAFLAKHLGLDVEVLEPNPDYAIHCNRILGLDVQTHTFWDTDYPAGSFDIIRIHHLLVHARDPLGQLRRLQDWLKDDGLLYIELPNLEADAAARSRGALFDAGHVMNFNPATLRSALGVAGFTEAEQTTERHKGTTAGFFRKSNPGDRVRYVAGNAQRVSDAITKHYARAKPHASLGRLVEAIASRAAERRELKAVSGHRDAAEQTVERLKAKLSLLK